MSDGGLRDYLRLLQGGGLPGGLRSELREQLDEPTLTALLNEGLLVPGELSPSYPSPTKGSFRRWRVTEHPNDPDRPFLALPDDDEPPAAPLRLTEKQLETWTTSRAALVELLREQFCLEGEPSVDDGIMFVETLRLGRGLWCGSEREVLLCTNLNVHDETVPKLLLRKALGQKTLVLAHARMPYLSSEVAEQLGPDEAVDVVFLEDVLDREGDRIVLRLPPELARRNPHLSGDAAARLAQGEEKASARVEEDHIAEQRTFCTVIDRKGCREIDAERYQAIVEGQRELDLFIDGTSDKVRVLKRASDQAAKSSKLTVAQFKMLLGYVERAAEGQPYWKPSRVGGPHQSVDAAQQTFKRMRRAMDTRLGGQSYLVFKHRRAFHGGEGEYAFIPPPGFRYCILAPMAE